MTSRLWRSGAWRPVQSADDILPTAATTWKGIDATAYIPDPAWFTARFREGYRLYCLHTTDWNDTTPWWRTEAQIGAALDAGLRVGAYTRDPKTWEAGINACGPYVNRLQFFALDVELEGPTGERGNKVTRAMVDGVKAMGVRPVIYSGSGMWPVIMGSSSSFSDVPLWDTDTASPPDPDTWTPDMNSPTPVPYAGWNVPAAGTMRRIVQQAFNVQLGGIQVDLNSVDSSFLEDR